MSEGKKVDFSYKVDAASLSVEISVKVDLDLDGKPGLENKTVLSYEMVEEIYGEIKSKKA